MTAWGGPQWVLATLMVVNLLVAIAVRAGGYNRKPAAEWGGMFLSKVVNTLVLAGLLWWGGFWS